VSERYVSDWEQLCAWLEDQPHNATYHIPDRWSYLTLSPAQNPIYQVGREKHERAKRIHNDRQPIMYWATGYGWRLRKAYRDELAALRRRYEVPA
jgi:hypothetical protein